MNYILLMVGENTDESLPTTDETFSFTGGRFTFSSVKHFALLVINYSAMG